MLDLLRPAAVMLALFTALTGFAYPLLVSGVASAAFSREAGGSLFVADGQIAGSELVGQPFDDPRYFWGRPSATAPHPYNGAASTGSNLGPSNPALADAVKGRIEVLRAADPGNEARVPVDLVTASGSGLDPHISPAAAYYQAGRVARVRGVPESRLRDLVASHVEGRTLGVLGEPCVNVLRLNLALDDLR
jgi:K+-transporting ATPase ATPase C chain